MNGAEIATRDATRSDEVLTCSALYASVPGAVTVLSASAARLRALTSHLESCSWQVLPYGPYGAPSGPYENSGIIRV